MVDMNCKFCHSSKVVKHGLRFGLQRYLCKNCNHHFNDNQVSQPRMRVNTAAVVSALDMFYGGLSMRKTAEMMESIYGEKVSQSTIHFWVHKFAKLVATELLPSLEAKGNLTLSGKYHHDETELKLSGKNGYQFWEMIDQDTKMIVANMLTESRTTEDAIKVFQMAMNKQRPTVLFTDGSFAYSEAYKKVFYNRVLAVRTEWIRRVGIRARETNNVVERLHVTLKDRTRSMRGMKNFDSTKSLLSGYVINYNYCRKHQTIKKTPAQAAGLEIKGWKQLIERATESKTAQEIVSRAMEIQVRA